MRPTLRRIVPVTSADLRLVLGSAGEPEISLYDEIHPLASLIPLIRMLGVNSYGVRYTFRDHQRELGNRIKILYLINRDV